MITNLELINLIDFAAVAQAEPGEGGVKNVANPRQHTGRLILS